MNDSPPDTTVKHEAAASGAAVASIIVSIGLTAVGNVLTALYGTVAFIYVAVVIAVAYAAFVLWRVVRVVPVPAQAPLPAELSLPPQATQPRRQVAGTNSRPSS